MSISFSHETLLTNRERSNTLIRWYCDTEREEVKNIVLHQQGHEAKTHSKLHISKLHCEYPFWAVENVPLNCYTLLHDGITALLSMIERGFDMLNHMISFSKTLALYLVWLLTHQTQFCDKESEGVLRPDFRPLFDVEC